MEYLDYFQLSSEPFSNAPLSRFYFASRQHTEALNRLMYAASSMKGLAILIGDIGHGKTTLARRMLDALPESEYEAAMLVIVHAGITPNWLLKRIASQLGVSDPADDKLTILSQLYQRLLNIYQAGKRAVVIIDEAQMLATRELMEEFRGLLNLEVPDRKLITFVFFGLPEIEKNLRLDPPLAQRIALRYQLRPLTAEDTSAYIDHRLR
ncbi:MAG: AAA family ATPase, partial [Clostridia bacterium]|nr:AAA family ATPase [Deltaproteobacteria bacterium]